MIAECLLMEKEWFYVINVKGGIMRAVQMSLFVVKMLGSVNTAYPSNVNENMCCMLVEEMLFVEF